MLFVGVFNVEKGFWRGSYRGLGAIDWLAVVDGIETLCPTHCEKLWGDILRGFFFPLREIKCKYRAIFGGKFLSSTRGRIFPSLQPSVFQFPEAWLFVLPGVRKWQFFRERTPDRSPLRFLPLTIE